MSEKAKELQKKLFNKKENGVDFMSVDELKACDEFCEGYKKFLFENKTEREFAASALKLQKSTVLFRLTSSARRFRQATRFIISTGKRQLSLQLRVKDLFATV